ncbi:MAG TPA: YidC/Oxa1 family membrane protein insertase [Candidatus Saccharimonadales bacterium]|nr:YidC/Oxa1 family membrane protein insertase [Candidatus Saccharimonadales bacterium]
MFNKILVQPLFNLLMLIYAVLPGHDFGIAVIILTILVRLALWPVLSSQLRSQKKLQDLAPEVAKVRKKAAGDKQLESKMLMELYKEKEINPFASILPLLIQLPLFLALFIVLKDVMKPGEIAHLMYEPLKSIPIIKEIIANPAAFKPELLGIIDLTKPNIFLAITAGIAQYFQTKQLMPKSTSGDTQAQVMNSTTKIFPFLTFLIALRLPSALALYWTVASLVAILQQSILLREDVRDLEKE